MFSPKHCFQKNNACTRANHAHYSSVHVKIFSSSKHTLLKQHLGKNLTGRKCGAYRTISYSFCKICRALCIAIEKKKRYKSRFAHAFGYIFFSFRQIFYFFSKFRRIICTIFLCNKKHRSPCSFKRKGPSHLLRFPLD